MIVLAVEVVSRPQSGHGGGSRSSRIESHGVNICVEETRCGSCRGGREIGVYLRKVVSATTSDADSMATYHVTEGNMIMLIEYINTRESCMRGSWGSRG